MSYTEEKNLQDEMLSAVHQFREANDKVLDLEKKVGHAAQDYKDIRDTLNNRIDEIETKMNRTIVPDSGKEVESQEMKYFNMMLRKGEDALSREVKQMNTIVDPDGGYLVPPEWADMIGRKYIQYSPIRPLAKVVQISSNLYKAPYEGSTDFETGWVSEIGSRPETTTATIRMDEIPVNEMYANAALTQTLLNDAGYDVTGWMNERIGTSFMVTEGTAFVSGTGVGQPEGLLTNTDVSSVASGDATSITADAVIEMYYSVADYYAPNSTWLMKRSSMQAVRQLKDSYGQYLWQPGLGTVSPPTLMGQPYVETIDMPAIAAGTFPIIFGDIRKAYTIVDNRQMTMIRDPYSNKPYVQYYFTRYTGGQVVLPEAMVKMEITT